MSSLFPQFAIIEDNADCALTKAILFFFAKPLYIDIGLIRIKITFTLTYRAQTFPNEPTTIILLISISLVL